MAGVLVVSLYIADALLINHTTGLYELQIRFWQAGVYNDCAH